MTLTRVEVLVIMMSLVHVTQIELWVSVDMSVVQMSVKLLFFKLSLVELTCVEIVFLEMSLVELSIFLTLVVALAAGLELRGLRCSYGH